MSDKEAKPTAEEVNELIEGVVNRILDGEQVFGPTIDGLIGGFALLIGARRDESK